jgi:hypothetical protein
VAADDRIGSQGDLLPTADLCGYTEIDLLETDSDFII